MAPGGRKDDGPGSRIGRGARSVGCRRRDPALRFCAKSGVARARVPARMMLAVATGSRMWALSSGGERFLDAEEATGSNPVAPTIEVTGPGHAPGPLCCDTGLTGNCPRRREDSCLHGVRHLGDPGTVGSYGRENDHGMHARAEQRRLWGEESAGRWVRCVRRAAYPYCKCLCVGS